MHIHLPIQHSYSKVNQARKPQTLNDQQIAWHLQVQLGFIPPTVDNNPSFVLVHLLPKLGNFLKAWHNCRSTFSQPLPFIITMCSQLVHEYQNMAYTLIVCTCIPMQLLTLPSCHNSPTLSIALLYVNPLLFCSNCNYKISCQQQWSLQVCMPFMILSTFEFHMYFRDSFLCLKVFVLTREQTRTIHQT